MKRDAMFIVFGLGYIVGVVGVIYALVTTRIALGIAFGAWVALCTLGMGVAR